MSVDCLRNSVQLVVRGLIKNKLLAMVLLLAAAQPSLAQLASTALPTDLGSGGGVGTADLPGDLGSGGGVGTADLPGTSTHVGGVGTQEIPEDEIEPITPLPEQIGPEGVVRTTAEIQAGEVSPEFVGGELQAKGKLVDDFLLLDFDSNAINNVGKDVGFSGIFSGPGGMIYKGKGVTTLSGMADYAGDTVVEEGTLSLKASSDTFGVASSSVDAQGGATLQLEARAGSDGVAFSVNFLSLEKGSKLKKLGGKASLSVKGVGLYAHGEVTIDVADLTDKGQIEEGLHLNPSSWSGEGTITKNGSGVLTIGCERQSDSECSAIGFSGETSYDYGGTINVNEGWFSLYRASLPNASIHVSNEAGGLEVGLFKGGSFQGDGEAGSIAIGALSGDGRVIIDTNGFEKDTVEFQVGSANLDSTFSGVISGGNNGGGSADFAKVGTGTLTLAGANAYEGKTTIRDGVLALANGSCIPQPSPTLVTGLGHLDLASNLIERVQFSIDQMSIEEGGRLYVRASQPLVSKNIVLNANAAGSVNAGGIAVALKGKNDPPIRVSDKFDYQSGSLVVAGPETEDPEGSWKIIDGPVNNALELARNTYLTVSGSNQASYAFEGLGEENMVEGGAFYQGYLLEEGSLDLVIKQKSRPDLDCDLNPDQDKCKDEGTVRPPVVPPIKPPTCDGDDCLVGNELPVYLPRPDEEVSNELPGCEVGDDFCDIISDIPGDKDDATDQEEEIAGEIIDGIGDGLGEEEIDLPLGFDYGQLAKLVVSGLTPRNIDAAGRGMQTYNNLLVDTLFERLPLRQFSPVAEEAAVVDEKQVIQEAPTQEPVRGLWNKSGVVSDAAAQQVLDQAIAQADPAGAGSAELVESELKLLEFEGIRYAENPSLTDQLSERDGWRGWFRGFGGNSRAYQSTTVYNEYALNAGGGVVGADLSLSDSVQVGVYANYGNVNVNQLGQTGGGSWNPDGWGGGITADYWTKNFYVQGLLGATGFSGTQKRGIVPINQSFGGESATAEKSATSIVGALRVGAPFQSSALVLEPQLTATWTNNNESGFSEGGVNKALQLSYGSRTTNYLQTALGIKLAYPINSGDRAQWVPMVRLAWLADWDTGNGDQSIGYSFTKKTVDFTSDQSNENGALIEGGLDYTIANLNSTSFKVYAKGGAEIWGGDRGTNWRASGGVTFQF